MDIIKNTRKFDADLFWTRVDSMLNEKGMTITSLSEKLGHSKSYLSTCKKKKDVRVSLVLELALNFSCSTDYLLGLTDDRRAPQKLSQESCLDSIIDLAIQLLGTSDRRKLLDYIASISPDCQKIVSLYQVDINAACRYAAANDLIAQKRARDITAALDDIETSVSLLRTFLT